MMKNLSPEKENTGNMPASLVISSTTGQAGPNQGQIKTKSNLGVICCDSELAKSFQVLKDRAGSIGHPGHYIQKSLNKVTTNSRSQSLPSCLETRKSLGLGSGQLSLGLGPLPIKGLGLSSPNTISSMPSTKIVSKQSKVPVTSSECQNESWFRTWPERGNERLGLLTPNNNSDLPPNYLNNSDIESDCDNDNYKHQTLNNSNSGEKLSEINNSNKSTIPLSELLESIPLAYSPLTRQLHIINRDESQEPLGKCRPVKENELGRDILRPLESIEEDLDENAESPRSTLQRTDASSFSSIVSSLSDISPSATEEDLQGSRGRDSRSSGETCSLFEDVGAKPKRKGLTGFFTRSVFGWKSQPASPTASSPPSWKLFGNKSQATTQLPGDEDLEQRCDSPCSIRSDSSGNKKYEDVVASSSALILHNRPANLPAKSQDEEAKHRQEYEQMVEAARKKELKEAKCRKKQLQQQLKFEEQLATAARVWNQEILPKWELMRGSRKARELWWRGLPPSVRGKVWRLAICNDLNVTRQLYEICVARAQERLKACTLQADEGGAGDDKESSVELIQLDIARTFPHLCIFQQGGPYYDMIHCLLGAYACYRPDVGYVQGMSFVAAVLILNLDVADAFICFANLLNRPCHMAFFRLNQTSMQAFYATYDEFFLENLPRLYQHFLASSLTPDLYLLDWIYTVFAKAMPLDVACRVWDVFLRDGEEFLFRTALGVLHYKQEALLQLDFLCGAQFLTKLPDDLSADDLFKSIEAIRMSVGKSSFNEVLARHVDRCNKPS